MGTKEWLARYATVALVVVGGLLWLLGETVSRVAAAPMPDAPRSIIEDLGNVGFFFVSSALMLAVLVLVLAALSAGSDALVDGRTGRFALACYLALFAILVGAVTLLSTQRLIDLPAWLKISLNMLCAGAIWWLAFAFALDRKQPSAARFGVTLIALAYTGWTVYVLQQLSATPETANSDASLGLVALNLGELAAIAAPVAFFWAVAGTNGEWRHRRRWIAPVVVALLFSAGNIADMAFNMGFTGVFTTWSLGLNLVWPWPLYAVSLALYVYAVITALSSREAGYASANVAVGLILLLFAGFSLQISYQFLLAVLSMTLLTRFFQPFSGVGEPASRLVDDGRWTMDDGSPMYRPSSIVHRRQP